MSAGLNPKPTWRSLSNRSSLYSVPDRFTSGYRSSSRVTPLVTENQTVRQLPQPQPIPLWLRSLVGVQRGTSLMALVTAGVALAIYSQIVHTQQLWSQEYRNLEILQRHERQLVTANEALKNQIAQQAERPGTGLVAPTPASTLFLQPTPQRPAPAVVPAAPTLESDATEPLGY